MEIEVKSPGQLIKSLLKERGWEQMIDKATGHDRAMAEDFIKWCAEVYGLVYLPDDCLSQIMKPATT